MNAQSIVIGFFVVCGVSLLAGLIIMGLAFLIMSLYRMKKPEINDAEYMVYLKKGYVLRFCYGYNVAADLLLHIIEIAATGLGTFIVLIDQTAAGLVAIMLITSFISSSVRGALNLKYNRIAYARAFRILEFAVDEYRISAKDNEAKKRLQEANIKAQQIISDFIE